MPGLPFTLAFTPRFSELDERRRLRADALLDWLRETAGRHADVLGLGFEILAAGGIGWALGRLNLILGRVLHAHDRIRLSTWPSVVERGRACREFEAHDEAGDLVLQATSAWAAFDLATRRPVADLEGLLEGVPRLPRRAAPFTTRTVPALRDPVAEARLATRYADLDVNGHVNNARLVALLPEPLGKEASGGHSLRGSTCSSATRSGPTRR